MFRSHRPRSFCVARAERAPAPQAHLEAPGLRVAPDPEFRKGFDPNTSMVWMETSAWFDLNMFL